MKILPTALKLAAFLTITGLTAVLLGTLLQQGRSGESTLDYHAVFRDASFLKVGDEVRISGIRVGQITDAQVQRDSNVLVSFDITDAPPMTTGARATVRYKNLVGDRYLELAQGTPTNRELAAGGTIPEAQTTPALDLDTLVGGFQPLFRALDPEQVNRLSRSLIEAFQGEAGSVNTLLSTVASVTSTLADHDKLIGNVINNLNSALDVFTQRDERFSNLVGQLQELVTGLAAERDPIGKGVEHISQLSTSASGLLEQVRPDLKSNLHYVNTVGKRLSDDRGELQRILVDLPDALRGLNRIGLHGSFWQAYICDLRVKLTGPDGKPLYTPWINSSVSRCGKQGN